MRRIILSAAVACTFVASLLAADVSGKWVGTMASGNGVGAATIKLYLVFHRSGDSISGTAAYGDESKPVQIENPSLNGNEMRFEVHDNPFDLLDKSADPKHRLLRVSRVVKFNLAVSDDGLDGEADCDNRKLKIVMARPK
jgi:hypothetical protein